MNEYRTLTSYYPDITVSNTGEVVNKTGKVLKQSVNPGSGHLMVSFSSEGKVYRRGVHQLVAMGFPEICGEWYEGCSVHHIDHNPQNNNVENLTIVSPERHRYIHSKAYDLNERRVFQYDTSWNIENFYSSVTVAADELGYNKKKLLDAAITGKEYKGYKWALE